MYRRITASCIILFILINGFKNETLKQTGFLGKSVTLPSGVNETGKFTTIEWSILAKNNTYIARFSGGNVKYYQQQRDRLKLDTTTGDLEIRDLRREDSGTYTVHVRKSDKIQWNNKVNLSVQEKLPEPSITVTNRKIEYGMCKILLTCSVKSETTTITYGPEGFPHGCEFKPLRYATTGREAEAWCSPIQDVNITCTASDSVSTTASTVRTGCSRTDPVFICSAGCGIMCFFGGVIITAAVCIVLYIKCDARSGFVRTPWARLRERLPRRCRYILARSEEAPRTSHEPTTPESAGRITH
uniref:Immunoglobulin domain-containing protein n=1 Tax=Paramormyrops kingsleyae TaxID=1676925 RepID=A0A3B3RD33_9TELE